MQKTQKQPKSLKEPKGAKLLPENEALLEKFIGEKRLELKLAPNTVKKYKYNFLRIQKLLKKPFERATVEELKKFKVALDECKDYTGWTIPTTHKVAKQVFRWLGKDVAWWKIDEKDLEQKLPEDLLTEDDILKLITYCLHPRDKALIAVLYESGIRAGELLSPKLKNIVFDELGALIKVRGKTGERQLRLVFSAPYLSTWINMHPFKSNRDANLWVGIGKQDKHAPLNYINVNKLLKRAKDRAGIKKPINPHHFRHSRASYLANFLTEAQLKLYFGWTQSSDMAQIYVHLSDADVGNAILGKVYGLIKKEEKGSVKLIHKRCLKCKEENTAEVSRCTKCGFPLDPEEIAKVEESQQKTVEALVMEVLKSHGLTPTGQIQKIAAHTKA